MKSESERADPLQRDEKWEQHGGACSHRTVLLVLDSVVPATSEGRRWRPRVEDVTGKVPPCGGAAQPSGRASNSRPGSHATPEK